MITETILNKFRNNILNEDLHLPHGTKSAKVPNLDWLFGALL
jgi:hypothetical protein